MEPRSQSQTPKYRLIFNDLARAIPRSVLDQFGLPSCVHDGLHDYKVLTVGDFYELAAGGQIIFT